jgi:hypothetical protein
MDVLPVMCQCLLASEVKFFMASENRANPERVRVTSTALRPLCGFRRWHSPAGLQ